MKLLDIIMIDKDERVGIVGLLSSVDAEPNCPVLTTVSYPQIESVF